MSLKPSVVVPTRRPSTQKAKDPEPSVVVPARCPCTQKAEGPELKTRAEY